MQSLVLGFGALLVLDGKMTGGMMMVPPPSSWAARCSRCSR
jgi:ABC-type protease/lipase transport system fused ATPase/permease subunit